MSRVQRTSATPPCLMGQLHCFPLTALSCPHCPGLFPLQSFGMVGVHSYEGPADSGASAHAGGAVEPGAVFLNGLQVGVTRGEGREGEPRQAVLGAGRLYRAYNNKPCAAGRCLKGRQLRPANFGCLQQLLSLKQRLAPTSNGLYQAPWAHISIDVGDLHPSTWGCRSSVYLACGDGLTPLINATLWALRTRPLWPGQPPLTTHPSPSPPPCLLETSSPSSD